MAFFPFDSRVHEPLLDFILEIFLYSASSHSIARTPSTSNCTNHLYLCYLSFFFSILWVPIHLIVEGFLKHHLLFFFYFCVFFFLLSFHYLEIWFNRKGNLVFFSFIFSIPWALIYFILEGFLKHRLIFFYYFCVLFFLLFFHFLEILIL